MPCALCICSHILCLPIYLCLMNSWDITTAQFIGNVKIFIACLRSGVNSKSGNKLPFTTHSFSFAYLDNQLLVETGRKCPPAKPAFSCSTAVNKHSRQIYIEIKALVPPSADAYLNVLKLIYCVELSTVWLLYFVIFCHKSTATRS